MAILSIGEFEAQYEVMGKASAGSVRPMDTGAWEWTDEGATCVYWRNQVSGIGLLNVFTEQPEGGVKGTQFYFNESGVIRALEVSVTGRDLQETTLRDYLLAIHSVAFIIDPIATVSKEEKSLF